MTSSDLQLRQHVQDELEWEPSVHTEQIGVSAHDAVVTLSGTVASFAEKQTAGEVVAAIRGVRGVANELQVKLPIDAERGDDAIVHTIASIFSWNSSIPVDRLKVLVSQGWVTLEGTVEWHFQRVAAERAISNLMGVRGITNSVVVRPVTSSKAAKPRLEAALSRSHEENAKNICVVVDENTLIISGPVLSPAVRDALEEVAWKTPGIERVNNNLRVVPLEELALAKPT